MKKIGWFDGKKFYFILAWRRWYAYIPFLKASKGANYQFISCGYPPNWFGKLPIMYISNLIITPYVAKGKILPIVYRREVK